MKSGALVFLVAFVALSASWAGFVLSPQLQLGRSVQTNSLSAAAELYPVARGGLAKQGEEVYRANGCVYCHSQQSGQDGTHCEIVLIDSGTNAAATEKVLKKLNLSELPADLPKTIMQVPGTDAADPILKSLSKVGAKAEVHVEPFGTDIARGWGRRHSVAQDYLYDSTVQLGTRRVGPDLSNVGLRLPDVNWHLRHLYSPQAEVKGSPMPPYRFLFEVKKIEFGHSPSPDALQLPPEAAPATGYEVVPTSKALALAAYLASLHADAPLFEAPLTPPPGAVASTNSPATNAPVSTAAAK